MKNTIKIILLAVFALGAIAGVMVYYKSQVSPPVNIKPVDQYTTDFRKEFVHFDTITYFDKSRKEYLRLNDKLQCQFHESLIEVSDYDEHSKAIASPYARNLTAYGFSLFRKPVWDDSQLSQMMQWLSQLENTHLTNGSAAAPEEFFVESNQLKHILSTYHDALTLSRSTGYSGVNDAASKIKRASTFRSDEYLKNNIALMNALRALPERLAQSHYAYVNGLINSLASYHSMTKEDYLAKVSRVDNAIKEYKNTGIYGSNKPSISAAENRAVSYVEHAMNYFD